MISKAVRLFALLLAGIVSLPAGAAPPLGKDQIATEVGKLQVMIDGRAIQLEVLLSRPKAEGRYPLAIITHGTPGNPDNSNIRNVSVMNYAFQAEDFARRGYIAAAVMRRGYGGSDGNFEESMGSCNNTNYPGAAAQTVKDLGAAIEALKKRADVDPQRIVAMGESAGGFAVTALSAKPPEGLRAAINFAGGRGSSGPNAMCQEHELVRTFGDFGKSSRIPTLWIYAQNDTRFGPELARRMHAAFVAGGGTAEFVATPPFGRDGHSLFLVKTGRADWWAPVDQFLKRTGLPTWDVPPSEPSVPDHPPPAGLGDRGKEAWTSYLHGNDNRAFAIAPDGRFGWRLGRRSVEEAKADALKFCGNPQCKIVAENDRLIP